MYERFLSLAADAPDAAALIDGATGNVTTRRALVDRAGQIAEQFVAAGLSAGDLVAIQLPNSVDFVASWLAACRIGIVVVPIDRDAPEHEVGRILSHFGVRALVYRRPELTITRRAADMHSPLPRNARLLKLTSGSTGMPKAIVTSEANLIADCENICSSMGITPDDVNLGAIPLSHSYGFSNLVSPLVLQGTAIVISNDYMPQSILALANRYHCTVLPGIPLMFDHLASTSRDDGAFESVRTFISAGAPLPTSTSRRFRERFGNDIHSFYGCSECGGITYDRAGAAVERGSVGAALDGVALDLDGPRVTVRSKSVALGYLHDFEVYEPFDESNFRTDDLVQMREDGEVVLTGRASELINAAGKKVNPREVENVILQLDGIREVKVYGEPAGARGEIVAAAVVADPDVTREQIRVFCRERLSAHKVPRIVKLIERIPVDERGKVKRAALAQL
jgi:long-chain acyl-CoA synthetase